MTCRLNFAFWAVFLATNLAIAQPPKGQGTTTATTTSSTQYPIVDTNQEILYDDEGNTFDSLSSGDAFYGQDANYMGVQFAYTLEDDDTVVYDSNTGLRWEKAHHDDRLTWSEAESYCESLTLGDKTGWRLPTIKELYSITDFTGSVLTGAYYLDNDYFDLSPPEMDTGGDQYSDMMGQTWSATEYIGGYYGNVEDEAMFFVNFLDGRIKNEEKYGTVTLFYRCVYGSEWGANDFTDNGDDTVSDRNSGLMWQQADDNTARNWEDSLAYCENLDLAGYDDWRLPNVKELQSIVDYTKIPAIDSDFFTQNDEDAWFWSSTTHGDDYATAAYVCFGKCVAKDGTDTHGAGAQRSDPKSGDPDDYNSDDALGGSQDDEIRVYNYNRCVRGGDVELVNTA